MRRSNTKNYGKSFKKAFAAAIAGVFLFTSTLGWAEEEKLFSAGTGNNAFSSGPADKTQLAAPLSSPTPEFKKRFIMRMAALPHPAAHDYIKGQILREQEICGDKWEKERTDTFDINDPRILGRIGNRVDGLTTIKSVRLTTLFAHTAQFGHVGLSGKDSLGNAYDYGMPVMYVDSGYLDKANNALLRHERDEILQWENLRVNILGISKGEMRDWIKAHVDSADNEKISREKCEEFSLPDLEGLNSLEVAKIFHEEAYPLDELYDIVDINNPKFFDYDYIKKLFERYVDEEGEDANISAFKAQIPQLGLDEIAYTRLGMRECFIGKYDFIKTKFNLPEPRSCRQDEIVRGEEDKKVTFFKRTISNHVIWAFKENDKEKIRDAWGLILREGTIPKIGPDEIACSIAGLGKNFIGDFGGAINSINTKLDLPEAKSCQQDEMVRGEGDKKVTFYKRTVGNNMLWAFKEGDVAKIGEIYGMKLKAEAIPRLSPDEITCSKRGLAKYFVGKETDINSIIKSKFNLPDPESYQHEKLVRGEGSQKVTFYKRTIHVGVLWAFKESDKEKIVSICKLTLRAGTVPKLGSGEIACSGQSIRRYFIGNSIDITSEIKTKFNLPEADYCQEDEISGGKGDKKVIFFKRTFGTNTIWAFKESDKGKIRDECGLTLKLETTPRLGSNEIACSWKRVGKYFLGHSGNIVNRIKAEFNLPQAKSYQQDEIVRGEGDKKITFYKRLDGFYTVWAFKKSDKIKVVDACNLTIKGLIPELSPDEITCSLKSIAKHFIGDSTGILNLIKTKFGLPEAKSCQQNEIVRGEGYKKVTFYKRLVGNNMAWAFKESDKGKIKDECGLTLRLEIIPELDQDEIACTKNGMSKHFIGDIHYIRWMIRSELKLPVASSCQQGELIRGEGDDKVTFFKRKISTNIIWAFKEHDKAKMSKLCNLKLRSDISGEHLPLDAVVRSKLKDIVDSFGKDTFVFLASRYSLDIKNILWGMIGSQLEGRYDKRLIERLIDEHILALIDENVQNGETRVEALAQAEEPKSEFGGPLVFEKGLLPEEISALAKNINSRLDDLENRELINRGMANLARTQAINFVKKLEERYFFKKYYSPQPGRDVGQEAAKAIWELLKSEREEIVKAALNQIVEEILAAMDMQDELHKNGLKAATNLNLYQLIAIPKILKNKKMLIADEMGMGKTLETISAFLASGEKEMLVLAPRVALNRWMDDLAKHTDTGIDLVILANVDALPELSNDRRISITTIKNSRKRYEYLFGSRAPPADGRKRIILMNYEAVRRFERYRQNQKKNISEFGFIALDEAHLLKNTNTATSKAILGIEEEGTTFQAKYKIAITGTPLENRPQDLFPILQYLARGGTGDAEKLLESIDLRQFSSLFRSSNLSRISQLHGYLAEHMIRRLKDDVVRGLPNKKFVNIKLNPLTGSMNEDGKKAVSLPGNYRRQLDLYELVLQNPASFEREHIMQLPPADDEEDAEVAEARTTQILRLQQLAIDPGIFGEQCDSIKYDALKKLVAERISQGKSVVIFTDYRTAAERTRRILEPIYGEATIVSINGTVKKMSVRNREIARFQSGEAKILIATTATAGLSIELTRADCIIWLNYPWKPSAFNQAIDRAHRLDSERNYPGKELEIITLELALPISIDELKRRVLKRKNILSEMIVNGNLSPEILSAFIESDLTIVEAIEEGTISPVAFDEYELTLLQQFRLKIGQILSIKDPARLSELWEEISLVYLEILEHKGSFFANMASLDHLASDAYPELKSAGPKRALDLASGPSTLYRAYQRKEQELKSRNLVLDITDYDLSPNMLKLGVTRPDAQLLGSFEALSQMPPDSYDIINLSYAFRYVTHPALLIRNIYRMLKDRGTFILILPSTNIIPHRFYEALQEAGFDLRVGEGAQLESMLDSKTYRDLVREYGKEFANDIAREAKGKFTYLVANKNPDKVVASKLNDEDFLLTRERPVLDGEKVEALRRSEGKFKIIPYEGSVIGEVRYGDENRVVISVASKQGRAYKRITRHLSSVTQKISMYETGVHDRKSEERFNRLEQEINELLTMIIGEIQSYKDNYSEEAIKLLIQKFDTFRKRKHIAQWLRRRNTDFIHTVDSILASKTTKGNPAKFIETAQRHQELLDKMCSEEGVTIKDILSYRISDDNIKRSAVYKEAQILRYLGVLIRVEKYNAKTSPRYKFSGAFIVPDKARTKLLLSAVSNVQYKVGIKEEPLQRYDIADKKDMDFVAELVRAAAGIEKAKYLSEVTAPAAAGDLERCYTIRYDADRLKDYEIKSGIEPGTLKILLDAYADLLRMRLGGKDRVDLKPSSSTKGKTQSLISVECYNRQTGAVIGKGNINIDADELEKDSILRIVEIANIAFATSNIPLKPGQDELDKCGALISFIQDQYKELTGQEITPEKILQENRVIILPVIKRIPAEKLREYYELSIKQLEQAA